MGDLVWTKRVVLPRGPWAQNLDLVAEALDRASEAGADYLAVPVDVEHVDEVPAVLSISDRIFAGVEVRCPRPGLAIRLARLLRLLFEEQGPEALTRLALGLGGLVESPYFPSTASKREGFSLSLLYADDLRAAAQAASWDGVERKVAEVLGQVADVGRRIAESSNLQFLGVDPSVSPWMEESVAGLVEDLLGGELGSPGTFHVISRLNSLISGGSGSSTLGFAEVMLPVAEDDRLKELAADGRLRLRDLVGLSMVCVAGLDMVALSARISPRELVRVIADAMTAARVKGREMGVRILLADGRPGDWVELGRFGSLPIVQL